MDSSADSIPRQSDFPEYDWYTESHGLFREGATVDGFWAPDVEAGTQVQFVLHVPQVVSGPFYYNISARARTAQEMASFLGTYVDLLRNAVLNLGLAGQFPEVTSFVDSPFAWQQYFKTAYITAGLVDGNEPGWYWVSQDIPGQCQEGINCWLAGVTFGITNQLNCGSLRNPGAARFSIASRTSRTSGSALTANATPERLEFSAAVPARRKQFQLRGSSSPK